MDAKHIFEILMRENSDMLLSYLRAGVRDSNVADDLFQETMLVAWKRLADFERSRPFGPWLRGIAGKILLSHYRRQAKQERALDGPALEWLDSRFAAIEQQQGDTFSEKLSALRECVASLDEKYRKPIQLRYQQNLPLEEIVESMSIALGTLKKRLTRSKSKLSDCLERKLGLMEKLS